jgi:hypothetical protein
MTDADGRTELDRRAPAGTRNGRWRGPPPGVPTPAPRRRHHFHGFEDRRSTIVSGESLMAPPLPSSVPSRMKQHQVPSSHRLHPPRRSSCKRPAARPHEPGLVEAAQPRTRQCWTTDKEGASANAARDAGPLTSTRSSRATKQVSAARHPGTYFCHEHNASRRQLAPARSRSVNSSAVRAQQIRHRRRRDARRDARAGLRHRRGVRRITKD